MIRLLIDNDVRQVYDIYMPYIENTVITFEKEKPSFEAFYQRVLNIKKNYPYLVYEEDGKILGYAYASRFRDRKAFDNTCELSIYLIDKAKGKGIGKKLLSKMLEYLRLQNINSVVSCITVPNLASNHLHESMGFTLCGYFHNSGIKFDKLLDVKFYELILSNEVKEFIPFSNLKII